VKNLDETSNIKIILAHYLELSIVAKLK